jgi:hypothetical protein
MEQSKAMKYGSRKASSDVLKPRNIYIYIYIHIHIYTHTHAHYLDDVINKHYLPTKYLCNNDKTEGHGTLPEKKK